MRTIKADNPNTQNFELIRTYYSGGKTSDKQFFTAPALWQLTAAGVLIILFAAGFYALHYKNKKTTALSPFKYAAGILYFDYEQIKDAADTITVDAKSKGAVFNLKEKDLSAASLFFIVKGRNGKEKLAIILKDKYNISNANRDDAIITPALLKNKWHTFKIDLENTNLPLNKTKVTQIRFDASASLTGNSPDATVYIKRIDIQENSGGDI